MTTSLLSQIKHWLKFLSLCYIIFRWARDYKMLKRDWNFSFKFSNIRSSLEIINIDGVNHECSDDLIQMLKI